LRPTFFKFFLQENQKRLAASVRTGIFMALILYGIPNCDSVKKARNSLTQKNIPYHFHDFKKAALAPDFLRAWLQTVPLDVLVNKKGTTWRKLTPAEQAVFLPTLPMTEADLLALSAIILANLSLIKRPVLAEAATPESPFLFGFDAAKYDALA
jgi:Spx/MgsR family transcriptional regulator